jgi:hypothetical protein
MRFKIPQDSENIIWTKHSIEKMLQYQLSESRIKRVLHTPHRIEEGIAPETIAVMQSVGTKKHPKEIWVMYQLIKSKNSSSRKKQKSKNKTKGIEKRKIRIISVWRYPGITPPRQLPPLPPEEWEIIKNGLFIE